MSNLAVVALLAPVVAGLVMAGITMFVHFQNRAPDRLPGDAALKRNHAR